MTRTFCCSAWLREEHGSISTPSPMNVGRVVALVGSNGKPLQRQAILDVMHLKHIQDVRAYDSMVEERLKDGALRWDGPILVVVTYRREPRAHSFRD